MEKLVRDNIPEIIAQNGEVALYRLTSSVAEKIKFLIEKATEEESEFQYAIEKGEKVEQIGEAADCAEVYNEIIDVAQKIGDTNLQSELGDINLQEKYSIKMASLLIAIERLGINLSELTTVQKKKREQRGGFEKGVILTMEDFDK